MPKMYQYELPKPTEWKEFEYMVFDYCESKLGTCQFWGRPGQKQDGIDIIVNNRLIGIQCKNYTKTPLDEQCIKKIISLADKFEPALEQFIIATTLDTDSKLQKIVLALSEERIKNSKFSVSILFWNDIESFIKDNENIFNKYYSGIFTNEKTLKEIFNDKILGYGILGFLSQDPLIGILEEDVNNNTEFTIYMNEELKKAHIKNLPDYELIKDFIGKFSEYTGYLSLKLFPINDGRAFTIQNEYDLKEPSPIKKKVTKYILDLDKIFKKINNGKSLFL